MTTSYLPYHPGQENLLPSSLQDWLPEGHLAYYISDTIDSFDLSAFHARYAKGGPSSSEKRNCAVKSRRCWERDLIGVA